MEKELKQIREALEKSVPNAIKEIGLKEFKETSFFMSKGY